MSEYSLQLRWLVEQTLADAKLPNIEANWHAAYDKLGLADYPIFDEAYRQTLNDKMIFDGRNLYEPALPASHGLGYVSIGRPVQLPQ